MAQMDLGVGAGFVIPAAELKELASRSGGPGGQHVNKSATRVSLRWNIRRSAALDAGLRARILARLSSRLTRAGELIVHADASRSRARNREAARGRMAELVAAAAAMPRGRRGTRPTRASRERRLGEKKRRGGLKKLRRVDPGRCD